MSIDDHENFLLNKSGVYLCERVLVCNARNNRGSNSINKANRTGPCDIKKSLMLHCCYVNPLETKKICRINKRELFLDFSYFCILMKELLDSELFRYGFIERCCSNETSPQYRNICKSSRPFSENLSEIRERKDERSKKSDNKDTTKDIQYNLLVRISDGGSNNDASTLLVNINCVDKEFILTNQDLSSFPAVALHISGPVPIFMDKRWCGMLDQSIQERIQLDVSMSWLSTLGGACSALGDYSPDWASKAALISSQQMKLAWRIGDPHILARCRLYAAIAHIQKGNFKTASTIIRREYDALRHQCPDLRDTRLAKMCQGIWVKLIYTKKFARRTSKTITN